MATNAVSFVATDKSWFAITDAAQSGLDMLTSDWAISGWIRLTSAAAFTRLVYKGCDSTADTGYNVTIDGSRNVIGMICNGSSRITTVSHATTVIPLATWTHFAVTYDRDGNMLLYLNGVLVPAATVDISSLAASSINSTNAFQVGKGSLSVYYDGNVQDLSIHSRLLTAAEVAFLYNSGTPYKYNAWGIAGTDGAQLKSGLVSYWYLNASGTTAADSHGSNDLTLSAAAIISPRVYGSELVVDGGFETVTAAGPPANFANWSEGVTDGNIEVETTLKHVGTNACKVTAGAGLLTSLNQAVSATAGTTYRLSLWAAGDGTNAGRYRLRYYDGSWKDSIGTTSTGITAGAYGLVTADITAPASTTQLQVYLYCPATEGGIAYFDDVSLKSISTPSILNGGFEDWTTSTNAANWTESVAGTSTVTREDTVVYSGTNAAALTVDGSNSLVLVRQSIVTSGKQYNYTIYARAASGTPTFKVEAAAVTNYHTLSTSFQAFNASITPDSTNFSITRSSTTSNTIYVDAVSLYAANILTGTGLDGAAPPAEVQRMNPFLLGWMMGTAEQDVFAEMEPNAAGRGGDAALGLGLWPL